MTTKQTIAQRLRRSKAIAAYAHEHSGAEAASKFKCSISQVYHSMAEHGKKGKGAPASLEVCALLQAGQSIKAIAELLGCTPGRVSNIKLMASKVGLDLTTKEDQYGDA